MCGPRKHNCQPLCGPEGRFYCSDSVCSLRPAPFSYLCVRVRILSVLKIVCCCRIKPDCRRTPAVVSISTDSAALVTVLRHSTLLHYIYFIKSHTSDSFVNHFDGHFAYLKTLDFSFKAVTAPEERCRLVKAHNYVIRGDHWCSIFCLV